MQAAYIHGSTGVFAGHCLEAYNLPYKPTETILVISYFSFIAWIIISFTAQNVTRFVSGPTRVAVPGAL
jgi:hypothetical protein